MVSFSPSLLQEVTVSLTGAETSALHIASFLSRLPSFCCLASSQRWSPASALWAPAAAAGQHRAPRRWPCWGCHPPLCLPMMASIAVGLGSAPSSAIASFDTLLSIQRYRGIVLCTALRYIWAARLCFHKWQWLRWGPVKGEHLALTHR